MWIITAREITSDKYLVVLFYNKLSFNQHVATITNFLNLCRTNLYMWSPKIKEAAYKSIVQPHLEYSSPTWNPHASHNIDRIEAVQTRVGKFVLGKHNYGPDSNSIDQINTQLKWVPLQHRRAVYGLSILYKMHNHFINITFPPTVQPFALLWAPISTHTVSPLRSLQVLFLH